MPRVGDGTGTGSMPPTEEGLSHVGGDEPEKPSGTYKAGATSGTGPTLQKQRTSPVGSRD